MSSFRCDGGDPRDCDVTSYFIRRLLLIIPTFLGVSLLVFTLTRLVPGGPIGEFKVPGNLRPGDTLLGVRHIIDGTPPTQVDRTAEFSIVAGKHGTIINTTTVTTGGWLHVLWVKPD